MSPKSFDLLVIDDDSDILRLLQEAFTDESLTVQSVASLAEARDHLARHSFRVILSDHNLPDGNGVDFLAELSGAGLCAVPILMTGMTDLQVAVEAINRGKVHKFVTKPLNLMELVQLVHRALGYQALALQREQTTCQVVEHNQRLKREAEICERDLQAAAAQIRAKQETVDQQQEQISDLYAQIQQAYLHTVTSLTAAIEAKDLYTSGHSERVFYYCSLMAEILGLPESARQDLRYASVLHDLGKIGIPDSILLKPGRLTAEEEQIMASHLALTDSILRPLTFLSNVRRIIRGHHERFDGKGYPDRLRGEQNSLEGRILAVADAYDAMRSDRAYRRALTRSHAIAELKAGSGSQFCPLCAGALLCALETRGEFDGQDPSESLSVSWEEEFKILHRVDDLISAHSVTN